MRSPKGRRREARWQVPGCVPDPGVRQPRAWEASGSCLGARPPLGGSSGGAESPPHAQEGQAHLCGHLRPLPAPGHTSTPGIAAESSSARLWAVLSGQVGSGSSARLPSPQPRPHSASFSLCHHHHHHPMKQGEGGKGRSNPLASAMLRIKLQAFCLRCPKLYHRANSWLPESAALTLTFQMYSYPGPSSLP